MIIAADWPEGSAAAPVATSSPEFDDVVAGRGIITDCRISGRFLDQHLRKGYRPYRRVHHGAAASFIDPALPIEFRGGVFRFWPDQTRLLESRLSVRDQIVELHESGVLGDLAFICRRPTEKHADRLWMIKTHAGHEVERRMWLRAVIAMEGRRPVV